MDRDATAGILDWDCTGFTYDGHQGHDIVLRSFGEQDVGSPIFAALDGTVVALHDGEFDRRTAWSGGALANYVVLDHGGGHQTFYYHMRSNSVAVTLNQVVTAGTQLGLAASSGFSDWPHLHFESQLNGVAYEPYAGNCQTSNPSRWVSQTPVRRDLFVELFEMHGTNNLTPFLPENPPRKGTFVRTGTFQSIGAWYVLHNQPAGSNWRSVYKRPDGSVFFASQPQNYNNATAYRWATWWMYWNINPDIAGTWTLEFSVNGTLLATVPFTVLDAGGVPVNRPPNLFTAAFEPPAPSASDVTFCRLTVPLVDDPDFDFLRFRYEWKVNGNVIRTVTNAAWSDAVRKGIAQAGDLLSCTVTAFDAATNGQPVTVGALLGGVAPKLEVKLLSAADFRLAWATSGPPVTLEYATNLLAPSWQVIANGISLSGVQNVITNPGTGTPRWFRLRYSY